MGDYITWLTPIEWMASECTWIKGNLIIPDYFKDLAEYFIKRRFPEWSFAFYQDLMSMPEYNNTAFRGPVELQREALNATGAHLINCGWVYFCNRECAPEGWDRYQKFEQSDLDALELPIEAKPLEPGKYAVLTIGQTTNSRIAPPGAWNHVIDHVVKQGLTPVFLGASKMLTGNFHNVYTRFDQGVQIGRGVDLRDKTTLMQAASIMSRAAVVIGHDNGLLHLAACTDVPIVFGYNIASPEHREPKRAIGRIFNVTLNGHGKGTELPCNYCQSNTNFVIGYNFRNCFYGDLKCMTMLFDNGATRWKTKIDEALECNHGK